MKMHTILKDSEYSYVASTKVITLAAPYTALSVGQIVRIANLTTGSVFYESETQRYPISISGADITHTYDDGNDVDADKLQIIIDIGGHTSTPLHGTVLPPEMLHIELRVTTSVATDDLTPTAGKKIRVHAVFYSSTVLSNLTSTLRATLAFGAGHTTVASKILASLRHINTNNPDGFIMPNINVVGAADEVIRLTNSTYSAGECITRAIVYYTEE